MAVKRLKEERTQGGELQFQTEVEMISMAVHRNLLRLRGFCMTPTERLLVYPYMANGSVASCLRGKLSLFKLLLNLDRKLLLGNQIKCLIKNWPTEKLISSPLKMELT